VKTKLHHYKNRKVSIVMNCFNGAKFVKQAIESVLRQTHENWELIFWDNQSTDNSAKIIKNYKDKRIRYFYAETFTSLGEARNLAIDKTRGSLIAFLDCDDLWVPEKLARQIPLFDKPEIGIVISDTVFFNESKKEKQLYKKQKPPEGYVFKDLLMRYFISLETVIIRKAALEGLTELFDTRFSAIEEYDLFIRLCHRWELGYVDLVLAKWRVHSESATWQKPELFGIERRLFVKKLSMIIPNFSTQFKMEYKALLRKCDYEDARVIWKNGDAYKARKLLKPHKFTSFPWLVVYILTFLPFKLFNWIAKIGKLVP
tara:strand:- start:1039 stop:1983 length:945 start_codon:yes stop_codon:yes gene_type:complete